MNTSKATLQSSEYKLLLRSFTEWLQLLNYSALSIPAHTTSLKDFLQYQEGNNKPSLQQLIATDASSFIEHLQNKVGQRTKKALSNNHINKYIQSLKLFSKYIRETKRSNTGFNLKRLEEARGKPTWLTKDEIQALYEATSSPGGGGREGVLLGIRDRAMLAVFYGCGLRLNEGACLTLNDIQNDRKVLHVRKGKHYKERFVPIAQKNYEELQLYVDYARPQLLQQIKTEAVFIDANKGRPLNKQSLYIRIKKISQESKHQKESRYSHFTTHHSHPSFTKRNEA